MKAIMIEFNKKSFLYKRTFQLQRNIYVQVLFQSSYQR